MVKLVLAFTYLLILKSIMPVTNGCLNDLLQRQTEEQYDGPYVYYKGNHILVKYILENAGQKQVKTDSFSLSQQKSITLKVTTDIPGKSFQVHLKKELRNEKSEFTAVKKTIVISDIEGNFVAFRKLLQANKVIDEDFNWKFEDGHLVLTGDFFDRGERVTEILWLIYYLEEQAKAAGGYVHFILGNHEIMNLNGDLRYTSQKYLDNAILLHEPYVTVYDKHSELGRWLRTKNIVEKIGDNVFVHGGISGKVNDMNISIPEINELARPYYSDTAFNVGDQRSAILLGDFGPFWYRGYYENNNTGNESEIDSTLFRFGVNHIITGHTIIADTISVLHKGRLLNTDVHHVSGKSEALLIENGLYLRVNAAGKKVLLMQANSQKD